MTANVFLSEEMDNEILYTATSTTEIELLRYEKRQSEERCKNLQNLVKQITKTFFHELSNLKQISQTIRQELSAHSTDYQTFQKSLLVGLQSAPLVDQQELERQIEVMQATHNSQYVQLTETINAKISENFELLSSIDKLRVDYDEIVSEMEAQETRRAAELETAVKDAEAVITKQLTLVHELELDQVKCNSDSMLESKHRELEVKEGDIANLHAEIDQLHEQITADSKSAAESLDRLRHEYDKTLEDRIADFKSKQEVDMKTFNDELDSIVEKAVDKALAAQRVQLNKKHEIEMQVLYTHTRTIALC